MAFRSFRQDVSTGTIVAVPFEGAITVQFRADAPKITYFLPAPEGVPQRGLVGKKLRVTETIEIEEES